jgi:ubiquinone biosynthesis O-methyltransferase
MPSRFRPLRYSSSLISSEIEKFSKVGGGWWDSSSTAGTGPLHFMNHPRIQFIRQELAKSNQREGHPVLDQIRGLRILDVGCGGGLVAEALARLGAEVTALDPSENNINVARAHSSCDPLTSSIRYIHSTVENFSESEEKFDAVVSLEVLGKNIPVNIC